MDSTNEPEKTWLTRTFEIWTGGGTKSVVDTSDPRYQEIKAMLSKIATVSKTFELTGTDEMELWKGATRYFDMFYGTRLSHTTGLEKEPQNDASEETEATGSEVV